jgi:heterodisulfide reductase subunit B
MQALGAGLAELEDWTCCGASAADATSHLLSMVLAARNLALGERMREEGDLLIPCSACYLNLRKVEDHSGGDPALLDKINQALSEEGLQYKGGLRVRHLLDIVSTDFEAEQIRERLNRDLNGLRVAPYYGCQSLRPYATFDDPEQPRSMESLLEALGAEVHRWSTGGKCCGAALMSTKKKVALQLSGAILEAAQGADCIVTVCPMCQMNLEAYQAPISREKGADLRISILYLPQLMGLAFGLEKEKLGLDFNLAITDDLRRNLEI